MKGLFKTTTLGNKTSSDTIAMNRSVSVVSPIANRRDVLLFSDCELEIRRHQLYLAVLRVSLSGL